MIARPPVPDDSRAAAQPRHRLRPGGLRRLWLATAAMFGGLLATTSGYWVLGRLHHAGVLEPQLPEPWSLFDCLYMTVITISTIGYTETLPPGPDQTLEQFMWVRAYTVAIVLMAMLVVGFAVSSATAFLVEGDLTRLWTGRRATKEASRMKGHYIVCGAGVTGTVVARELLETHHTVVIVEKDPEVADAVRAELGVPVIVGDSMDDRVLESAGIERAAGLAAALPSDRDNVFLIISARRYKATGLRIVSLASEADVAAKLFAAGADRVVAASSIGGMRLASELFRPTVTSFLDVMLRGREDAVRFAELELTDRWADKTLADLDLPGRLGLPVLAIRRADTDDFTFNPAPDTPLGPGVVLVTMGDTKTVERALAQR